MILVQQKSIWQSDQHSEVNFTLDVPTKWCAQPEIKYTQQNEMYDYFVPLKKYVDEHNNAYSVIVSVSKPVREVNPVIWLELALGQSKAMILERPDATRKHDPDSYFISRLKEDVSSKFCIQYSAAYKNGASILRLDVTCPEHDRQVFTSTAKHILSSFSFANPAQIDFIERLNISRLKANDTFEFQFPASWICQKKKDVCELTNISEGQRVGWIEVKVIEKTASTPFKQIQTLVSRYQAAGYHVHGAAILPSSYPNGFQAGHTCIMRATMAEEEFELPILVYVSHYDLITVSLVNPGRSSSPEWWAINARAFEIVCTSMLRIP